MTSARLELENLRCMRGGGEHAFSIEVSSFSLAAGEIVALTGPSGSGKSTLLEILGLALRPAAARVFRWRTESGKPPIDIAALWQGGSERAICRLRASHIGFVLQTGGLVPFLSVQENIALPRQLSGQPAWSTPMDEMIETLGIGPLLGKKPHQLSIGERQRSAIARALAHEPLLLLADEPTSALDPERANAVMNLLIELVRKRHGMAVIVTHDRERVQTLGLREIQAQLQHGAKAARLV